MFRKNAPKPNLLGDRLKAIAEVKAPENYEDSQPRDVRAQRDPVFKPAIAVTAFGEKVPVVIKNISETGARVEFFQRQPLRERLLLSESSLALRCWAEVVWEGENAVGLRFTRGDTVEGAKGHGPARTSKLPRKI